MLEFYPVAVEYALNTTVKLTLPGVAVLAALKVKDSGGVDEPGAIWMHPVVIPAQPVPMGEVGKFHVSVVPLGNGF
jgi:hypothetical protein